jgi:hypothetical protein
VWLATTERPAWTNRLATPHALWLSPAGLRDFGPAPGWRPLAGPRPAQAPTADDWHANFDAWCQAHAGRSCNLVLSAWLLHELVLDHQLPLGDDTARLAYARNLLRHYHGEPAAHWPLAAWQAAGRHGVSALHATTLGALQTSARRASVLLRSVRPWWSLALAVALQQAPRLARADQGRLLVVDGTLVTQIDLARGQLTQLLQRLLPEPTQAALRATLQGQAEAFTCALGHGMRDEPPANDDHLLCLGSMQGRSPAALWCAPEPANRSFGA